MRQRKAESEVSEHIKLRGTLQSLNGRDGSIRAGPRTNGGRGKKALI